MSSTINTINIIEAIAYGIADGASVGRFVAVGYERSGIYPNETYTGKMAYSDDGITWTAVSNNTFGTSAIRSIAYGNNRFVAVGSSGKMAYSDDNGVTWTAVADSTIWDYTYNDEARKASIYGIAYGNNRFVAGGASGKMAYSDDGVTWTAVSNSTFPATYNTSSGGTTYTFYINAIAYGNGKWVAVGTDGKMAYSDDGENWTAVADSTIWQYTNNFGYTVTADINGIAYGIADGESVGRFVAGGIDGRMAYSDDGENWTAVSDSAFGTTPIYDIAYGKNRFVAVGDSGRIAYSDDGANWTAVSNSTFPTSYTSSNGGGVMFVIQGIAYGNNRFVAVGDLGTMAYADW